MESHKILNFGSVTKEFMGINSRRAMNIAAKKIELIEWLTGLQDEKLINKVDGLKKVAEADWWDTLSKEQQQDIQAGLMDVESGKKKDFKKVLAKYR